MKSFLCDTLREEDNIMNLHTRQLVRIRVTNEETTRSKNFRLSNADLDDSLYERIYENPAASDVVRWPSEMEEQIKTQKCKIKCLLKRENNDDVTFDEDQMGKTNIQDLVDLKKDDDNHSDLIQLILKCSFSAVDEEEKSQLQADQVTIDTTDEAGRKAGLDHPISPSILKKDPASKRTCRKSVSFRNLEGVPELC